MNPFNQTNPKKLGRSVSIIGIGCTPFMQTLDSPETAGLTEGELFGYAALKAMADAGVSPKDVDFYFHGCANPLNGSNYITPNAQVAEWFGMRGKASLHHSEACCTGYLAVDIAAQSIASGKYDVVLTGGIDFGDALCIPDKPACFRKKFSFEEFQRTMDFLFDNSYTRYLMSNAAQDDVGMWYRNHAGLTFEEIDNTLCQLAIVNRENAQKNPLAIDRITYQEEAAAAGYPDVMEYMKSARNPRLGETQRISGLEHKCDGAACLILCATELAEKFTKNVPVEILGIGNSTLESSNPVLEVDATVEATRQVYQAAGVTPEEIDLLYANDFFITSQLISAEITGYIPDKQAWKYIMDGRTKIDGDKPINPNGGRTAFGHAHAASGIADFYDAVLQMRGQAGSHQISRIPKTVFLRGYGGGQNVCNIIIRSAGEPKEIREKEKKTDSIKLERLVKTYYEALEEGKILGRKCPVCGNVEWPPVYACNACGSYETEWVEMSGNGSIVELYVPSPLTAKPKYNPFRPFAYAWVKCEEGPERNVMVRNVTKENIPWIRAHMPYPVHMEIVQCDGYKTAVFAIVPVDGNGNPL